MFNQVEEWYKFCDDWCAGKLFWNLKNIFEFYWPIFFLPKSLKIWRIFFFQRKNIGNCKIIIKCFENYFKKLFKFFFRVIENYWRNAQNCQKKHYTAPLSLSEVFVPLAKLLFIARLFKLLRKFFRKKNKKRKIRGTKNYTLKIKKKVTQKII